MDPVVLSNQRLHAWWTTSAASDIQSSLENILCFLKLVILIMPDLRYDKGMKNALQGYGHIFRYYYKLSNLRSVLLSRQSSTFKNTSTRAMTEPQWKLWTKTEMRSRSTFMHATSDLLKAA